jgi:YwiC-like protein
VLIPREHGAYGQLAFPLATALAIGRPTPGAIALAVAGVAAFLGHESLLVGLGQRGSRAVREHRLEALRTITLFGALAAAAGVSAVVLLNPLARWSLVLPAVLTLQLGVAVFSGAERTIAGEILAAAALTSLSVPVAIGSGVTVRSAFTVFVVFALIFFVATTAVHAIIGRAARGSGSSSRLVSGVLTLVVLVALVILVRVGFVQPVAAWAALPVSLVALSLVTRPPSPQHLRIVGWSLVGATAATSILLVVALR